MPYVFLFLSDFKNLPKWDNSVLLVRKVPGECPGIGTTYQQIRKTDEQFLRVIEYLPNQSISQATAEAARLDTTGLQHHLPELEGCIQPVDAFVLIP